MEAIRNIGIRTTRVKPVETTASTEHFAHGINFYKLFYLATFASVAGFLIETIWCFIRNGQIEARASLIYGPFNTVYGMGALVLYLSLRNLDRKKWHLIFTTGFVAGTVVEYLASYMQEMLFGTVSWDYSNVPLNINGRVCLIYSLFWGGLALLWVYVLYPLIKTSLLKIPDRTGRTLAWVLLAFLCIDAIVSIAAISRWMMRVDGIPASGRIATILDHVYPDARMVNQYPNMQICQLLAN